MTVVLDGSSLDFDQVVRVARHGEPIELASDARRRIQQARRLVDDNLLRGEAVYGLTTGVGVLKRVRSDTSLDAATFERRLLEFHDIAQGPRYSPDIVRATALRMVNHFALGTVGVRAELVDRLIDAINSGEVPDVPMLGEQLVILPSLALGLLDDFPLAPGEGLALLSSVALLNGHAALAMWDLAALAEAIDAAAALSYEAFGCKLSQIHEEAIRLRRQAGVARSAANMRSLLAGSRLSDLSQARNLQDPVTFRCAAHVNGSLYDALDYGWPLLERDLNSSQSNPVILTETNEVIHIGNWEAQSVVSALDFLRISLAATLTASQERSIKLLDSVWSGLPTGLVSREGIRDSGLAMYQILVQALTCEARLLAQPVSFEVTSTSGAEGIEDRHSWGLLACRRLAEMVGLGERIAAVEMLVAAQAVELRDSPPWGDGTRRLLERIRSCIPRALESDPVPSDLHPLVSLIRSRDLMNVRAAGGGGVG